MQNQGQVFLNHFIHYFGEYDEVTGYESDQYSIQMLAFPRVFRDCVVFCSLGLSNYQQGYEVYSVSDSAFAEVSGVIASSLLHLLSTNTDICRGTVFRDTSAFSLAVAAKYQKAALYFTDSHLLPDDFRTTSLGGNILQAIFISGAEDHYITSYGWSRFESRLQDLDVDVFNLSRPSII